MNWSKAKTLLIIALVITNGLLIGLYAFQDHISESENVAFYEETVALMEQRKIFLDEGLTIDEEQKSLAVLKVQPEEDVDTPDVKNALSEQGGIDVLNAGEEELRNYAEDVLTACNFFTKSTVFDKIQVEDGNTLVYYKNEYNGIPVENSYLICIFDERGITDIERNWLTPVEYGDKKKSTISAVDAMIDFMSGRPEDEIIIINEVKLIYWRDSHSAGTISDTAIPTWKIVYNGDQVKHIYAYKNQ